MVKTIVMIWSLLHLWRVGQLCHRWSQTLVGWGEGRHGPQWRPAVLPGWAEGQKWRESPLVPMRLSEWPDCATWWREREGETDIHALQ